MWEETKIRRERTVGGLRVVEVAYAPLLTRRRTDCPDHQLWGALSGGWVCERNGSSTELFAGSAAHYRPGEPCRQRVAPLGALLVSVQIPVQRLDSKQRIRSGSLALELTRVRIALESSELALEESVLGLIEPEISTETKIPRWLLRVRDQLEASLDSPPPLSELSASANVHPVYLVSTFKAHFGVTMGAYLRRRRLELALRELASTSDDLATIAQRIGFYDQAHFTRHFRKTLGIPPSELRRLVRP